MGDTDDDDGGRAITRAVIRGHASELRQDLEQLEERVDAHAELIGDLRVDHARIAGRVEHLTGAYERAAEVATRQVLTDLEIKKADALAVIKERSLDRKHKRAVQKEMIFKVITFLVGVGTLVAAILKDRC